MDATQSIPTASPDPSLDPETVTYDEQHSRAVSALARASSDEIETMTGDDFAPDQTAADRAMSLDPERLFAWIHTLTVTEVRDLIPTLHRIADEHERRANRARVLLNAIAVEVHNITDGIVHGEVRASRG